MSSTGTQVEVVMPQMGVSVSEGTVTRWLKQVGEEIARDEPLLEISTDKVDTEVPSPGEGIVSEIRVQEGETVEVGSVLAVIAPAGAVPEPAAPEARAACRSRGDARGRGSRGSRRDTERARRARACSCRSDSGRRSAGGGRGGRRGRQREDVHLPGGRADRRRAQRRPGRDPRARARVAV